MPKQPNKPNRRTVFVLGAGASKDVHLPIGSELKAAVATALGFWFDDGDRMTRGDALIYEAIRLAATTDVPPDRSVYSRAARRITDAMPLAISIDHFLDAHNGDKHIELCGKLAVVRTILSSETTSLLSVGDTSGAGMLRFGNLQGTWFNSFFQLLTENCRAVDLRARLDSIALVVFNYDRCIEHYLYHALQTYYGIDAVTAAALVKGVQIFHPYGTVAALPWAGGGEDALEYGGTPSANRLRLLASRIKTFTEGTDPDSSEVAAIRMSMKAADRVVFLGFAFHRMNLDLLLPDEGPPDTRHDGRIFATAYNLSTSDCESISLDLMRRCSLALERIHVLNTLTCAGLFQEFRRGLFST